MRCCLSRRQLSTEDPLDLIVHEASRLEPEDRAAFLEQACDGDADLLREARELLELDAGLLAELDRPLFRFHQDEEDPGGFPPNWFSVSFANFPTEESLSLSEGGRRKTPLEPAK